MKIIGFSMVKNEEDIIEQFIRHNLHYCDYLYIYDHFSTDATLEIIRACQAEGLNVLMANAKIDEIIVPSQAHRQAEIINVMFRLLYTVIGEGVYFPLDADEFIFHPSGVEQFRIDLKAMKKNIWFQVYWRCLIADLQRELDDEDEDFLKTARKAQALKFLKHSDKKAVLNVAAGLNVSEFFIQQGNHSVVDNRCLLEKYSYDGIYYFHSPIRSQTQILKKIIVGWLANVSYFGSNTDIAFHWRAMYRDMMDRDAIKIGDISKLYEAYAGLDLLSSVDFVEPLNGSEFHYDLRYQDLRKGNIYTMLASLESLLENKKK